MTISARESHLLRDSQPMLAAALAYADLGWPIFPVWPMRDSACACGGHRTCDGGRNAGKHPISSLVPNGHTNATTDLSVITRWWTEIPDANIGLWCAQAGLVVVDVDPRNGGDASWAALAVPDSPLLADTGGGGLHQFYAAPDGEWRSAKHAGIDIKFNGYVILAPSNHKSGNSYAWRPGHGTSNLLIGLPPLPDCFIDDGAFDAGGTYTDEPLTDLSDDDVDSYLNRLSSRRWTDYEQWLGIGSALHHQYRGDDQARLIWDEHSKAHPNYQEGATKDKWRSFGKNKRARPLTFRTIIEWAGADDRERLISGDVFDEEPEDTFEGVHSDSHAPPATPTATVDLAALLGGPIPDEIDAIDTPGSQPASAVRDWTKLLALTADGKAWANHLHNIELIVRNDPRISGLPQLNEFTQETVQRGTPGSKANRHRKPDKPTRQLDGRVWAVRDTRNGDLWSDDKDFAIRSIIEAPQSQGGYGIKVSDRDLKAGIVLAANSNPFHPVREYLDDLKWDGIPRADGLFVDYLASPDDIYHRQTARLMLIGAVARIYEPGCKWDFCVILEGSQGKRKSTFIRILGKHWFVELDGDLRDTKQMIELMRGAWVMELPELSGFTKADILAIKAFISRQTDRARLAYARRAGDFPRQVCFVGSTNDATYLRDQTGGRRFWPVACQAAEIDTERLKESVDQLWAEAVVMYREMRAAQPSGELPLYLTGEALRLAEDLQESRRVETTQDMYTGRIEAWLAAPINNGGFDDDAQEPTYRDMTCVPQIWAECLNRPPEQLTDSQSQILGKVLRSLPGWVSGGNYRPEIAPYGRQRVYRRKSEGVSR